MNAVMRIQVRVINGATPEIKQIQAALTQLARSTAAAQATMQRQSAASAAAIGQLTAKTAGAAAAQRSFARHLSLTNLEKYGKNLQWTGRQIEFNFTLPLVVAGGAAFKWAMDNQRAMTQVQKVYGDTADAQAYWKKQGYDAYASQSLAAQTFKAELDALEKTFGALSSAFGVNRAEVNSIAGEWAAAGASGLDLAKSVKLTLEAMILGDMDAAKASSSLIAIQAQYGANTQQLIEILGTLNAVENQTGATMSGLIDAFARSAGSARTAGVGYRELAAMIAALTPATGSATNAGNALKTVFSRVLAPTKDAAMVMDKLGANTSSAAWASKTATERLKLLSKGFEEATGQQRANASAYIASRYQVNRFDVLMRELNSTQGYYQKALDATSSKQKIANQYQRELSTVLQSNPKKFDILKNTMKNMMTDAIIPMIPAILSIMQVFIDWGKAFQNIDPGMQKLIIGSLVAIAAFGTLNRLVGAAILLFTRMGATLLWAGRMIWGLVSFKWLTALVADFGAVFSKIFGKGAKSVVVDGIMGFFRVVGLVAVGAAKHLFWLATMAVKASALMVRGMMATARAMPLIVAFLRTIPATIAVVFGTITPIVMSALSTAWLYTAFFFQYQIPMAIGRATGAIGAAALRVFVVLQGVFARGFLFLARDVAFFFTATLGGIIYRGMTAVIARMAVFFGPMQALWRAGIAAMATAWTLLPQVGMWAMAAVQGVMRAGMAGMAAAQGAWRLLIAGMATAWAMFPVIAGAAMGATMRIVRGGMAAIAFMMSGGRLLAIWKTLWINLQVIMALGMRGLATMAPKIIGFLVGPWGIAIMAAIGIFVMFKDQIMAELKKIVGGFDSLPAALAGAFRSVINVITGAIGIIRDLLSYLNPFQRHSPSLVDNVKAGVAVIANEYAKLRGIGSTFAGATKALADFGRATARAQAAMDAADMAENRKNVVAAAGPGAGAAFDKVVASMKQVKAAMAAVTAQYAIQQAVVDRWDAKLKAANATLDKQQAALKNLQAVADGYQQQLDAAKDRLQSYIDAPLKGERAMNQAILTNTIAQKRLQLEMMKIEDATGPIDDVRNRIALMQGEIETLRGTQTDLRSAGAGSDILGVYDDQIKAIQGQQDAVTAQVKKYDDLKAKMEELDRIGQRMDLEKYLNFDAVHEQIKITTDRTKELTSGEIMAGIQRETATVDRLQAAYDAAAAAVARQQKMVDAAQARVDATQAAYDREKATLDQLGQAYDALSDKYDEMNSALTQFANAAESAMQKAKAAKDAAKKGGGAAKLSPAETAWINGGKGDFKDAGLGAGLPARTDWSSQAGDIDKMTEQIMKDAKKSFEGMDPFAGLKTWWTKAKAWWNADVMPGVKEFWKNLKNAFTADDVGIFDTLKRNWDSAVGGVQKGIGVLRGWWDKLFTLIGPDLKKIGAAFVDFKDRIVKEVFPRIMPLIRAFAGAWSAVWSKAWPILKAIGTFLLGEFLGALKVAFSIAGNLIGVVFNVIVDVVTGLMDSFTGFYHFVDDLFHGRWGKLWDDFVQMISGAWSAVWGVINGAGQAIWAVVKGIVQGIWNFFYWLYDELVGHSIIPDMVNAIVDWLKSLPGKAWDALKSFTTKVVQIAKDAWDGFTKKSSEMWSAFWSWLSGRPKAAWDTFIKLKDKLWDVAKTAFQSFRDKSSELFGSFITWLAGRPQAAYNNFIAIKTKLWNVAKEAWTSFKDKSGAMWDWFIGYLKNYPQNAYNNFIALKTKLWEVAKEAFQALKDKASSMVDGKGGFMAWIAGIPGRIAKALGGVGSAVGGAVKASWNGVANWLNDNVRDKVNAVTGKFGFTIDRLPTFQRGGVIPGRVSKKDNTIIGARTGEGVIVPELVKLMGGARGLNAANRAAESGNLKALGEMGMPGFASGGVVGDWLAKGAGYAMDKILGGAGNAVRKVVPGRPFVEDWSVGQIDGWRKKAKDWGDKKDKGTGGLGGRVLGGTGWQWQVDVLRKQFPGIVITSTNRPGAITASGNASYHSMGRAVDMAPSMEYFNWIRSTYGKNTKELIYSPAGNRQLKNGAPYTYTGAVKDMHYNHVHWAYDKGGFLDPGLTMAMNKTGKREMVLTAEDYASLTSLLGMLNKTTSATPGSGIARSNGALMGTLEGRLRRQEALAYSDTGGRTININGDLVLPNIKSGDDAEAFIRHLETLAG